MKQFLAQLGGFLLIPLALLLILEVLTQIVQPQLLSEEGLERVFSGVGNNYQWVNQVDEEPQAWLIGSSSVKYGMSCRILNEEVEGQKLTFLNLAQDARGPLQSYYILKQMDMTKVKALYFGVDTWIFTRRYYINRDKYLYLDIPFSDAHSFSIEHDPNFFLKRYASLAKYLMPKLRGQHANIVEVPNDFGSVELNKKAKNFNQSVSDWFQIDKFGWSELQFQYLKRIAEICEERGVKFYLFLPPKRADFIEDYVQHCQLIHKDFVKKLETILPKTEMIGHYDDLAGEDEEGLFVEAYHLNPIGQKTYSQLFAKYISENSSSPLTNYNWFRYQKIEE